VHPLQLGLFRIAYWHFCSALARLLPMHLYIMELQLFFKILYKICKAEQCDALCRCCCSAMNEQLLLIAATIIKQMNLAAITVESTNMTAVG
jgi:hypothetical protein